MEIEGRIFSGEGKGKKYVQKSEYYQFFSKLLGGSVYPGTLNVKISQEWREIPDWDTIDPGEYGEIFFKEGRINQKELELPIILVRPALSKYGEEVIEVVAREHLRKMLNLEDGDIIYLETR